MRMSEKVGSKWNHVIGFGAIDFTISLGYDDTNPHETKSLLAKTYVNPSTRVSLLLRIKDKADTVAWSQFVDIYGPLIYRFGRRKGLQDADATDLMQDVFRQISQSIANFQYDPELGKFRSWLFVVSSHALSKKFTKGKRQPIGTGESGIANMLEQVPSSVNDDDIWEKEYRDHLFAWACDQIQNQFNESTWIAFYDTAVKGEKPVNVAEKLGISVGAVYIARTRVTQRLKDKIATIDQSV